MYYSNFDLNSVITPVETEKFISMLKDTNYDPLEIEFLEEGFTWGFDIGYEGPQQRTSFSESIPLSVGTETDLWNKLMKEVQLKRVAGPF